MVVINFNDQIQTGTFEHAVHHLVDNKLDLSLFEQVYKNDEFGRPAYDPAKKIKDIHNLIFGNNPFVGVLLPVFDGCPIFFLRP